MLGWRDQAYPYYSVPPHVWDELADPSITKVAFSKADHRWMIEHNRKINGPFHDVQVMAWCLDERTELSLDAVAKLYGAPAKDKRLVRKEGKVWFKSVTGETYLLGDAPMQELLLYNTQDLLTERCLYLLLSERLVKENRYDYFLQRHAPYTEALLKMETTGLPINIKRTEHAQRKLQGDKESKLYALLKAAGLPEDFNLSSNDQLRNYLFSDSFEWKTRIKLDKERMARVKRGEWVDEFLDDFTPTKVGRVYVTGYRTLKGRGIKPTRKALVPQCANRDKGTAASQDQKQCLHWNRNWCIPSVSGKTLRVFYAADDEWVQELCGYLKTAKALQFLDTWLEEERDGRLFTHFNQTGTATGRLSSSDPVNLQQVPSRGDIGKRFRSLFEAPEDYRFIHADFDQIEPRLMAHFSQDPFLLDVFERGVDLYEEFTVPLLGARFPKGTPERQLTRTCFLALGYGAKPPKIRRNLAEEGFHFSEREVGKAYNGILECCSVFREWGAECIKQAEADGYVETIGGHRRHISWIDSNMRWKFENQSVNSKIQGSAADITAGTLVGIHETMPQVQLCAAVHDELLGLVHWSNANKKVLETFQWWGEEGHGFKLDGVALGFKAGYYDDWGSAK